MYKLSEKTEKLIKKAVKGKKHLKLNIGVMIGDKTDIRTFDENGEIEYENNIYEIGSITKVFTTSLLAKMVFENKMQLEDSIKKYIPELNQGDYYPSLLRLAAHKSGISSEDLLGRSKWENFLIIIDMLSQKHNKTRENFLFMDYNKMLELYHKNKKIEKEYKWKYSNFGISMLGYAIGAADGRGYWEVMNDYLKNDLGLKNTYLGTMKNKNLNGFSNKNENWGNYEWEGRELMAPAGALSSTAEDLLTFAKINMEKNYLTLCHKKYTNLDKKYYDMGLGWWLDKKDNNVMMHGGTTGCFDTFLILDKEKKIAAAFLPNYRMGLGLQMTIGPAIMEDIKGN